MKFIISARVRKKLAEKHSVTEEELCECFANRAGRYLEDTRENRRTDPPTRWFISETEFGRQLKVVFMSTEAGVVIKSAFEPIQEEIRIYNKFAR